MKKKEGFKLEDLLGVPPKDFKEGIWDTGFWISGPCNEILNSNNEKTGFSITGPTGNDLWHFTENGIEDTGYSLAGGTGTDFYCGMEKTPYFLVSPIRKICYWVEKK